MVESITNVNNVNNVKMVAGSKENYNSALINSTDKCLHPRVFKHAPCVVGEGSIGVEFWNIQIPILFQMFGTKCFFIFWSSLPNRYVIYNSSFYLILTSFLCIDFFCDFILYICAFYFQLIASCKQTYLLLPTLHNTHQTTLLIGFKI